MTKETFKERNLRMLKEAREAREARVDRLRNSRRLESETQEIVQEDWTLEEDLPDDSEEDDVVKPFKKTSKKDKTFPYW